MAEPSKRSTRSLAVDQELVVRFVAGERAAFAEVHQLMRKDIFLLVRRFFPRPFEQEEAFQEVWVQLHRARGRFDVARHREFVPWVRQVARNRCRDLLRKRGRVREIPVQEVEETFGTSPDQLRAVARTRVRDALALFTGKLGQEEQRFFQLCFSEEGSHEEVSRGMGITMRRSKYLKKKLVGRMMKDRHLKQAMVESSQ